MIAHLDADSFFASVLVRKHPHLRGKPLLAVGMGGGCIIAATYEAKAFGVKTGMRLSEARKLVPNAIEMPSDFRETGIASSQIESILKDICPIVEQMSIDEWFLDLSSLVGGDPDHPEAWAKKTREKILRETDLSMSIGVAPTKTLSKMASEYRKPGGITVVEKRNIEQFLKDRPAGAICGIGRQRSIKTDAAGWITAWDLARAPDNSLRAICGSTGIELKRELLGEQVYTVSKDTRPPKSISRCRAFRATADRDLVKAHLLKHLEYCIMKMRRDSLACREISVWLRTGDYDGSYARRRLHDPCTNTSQLVPAALSALEELLKASRRYTQVGLALHGLRSTDVMQQSLFDDTKKSNNEEHLQKAIDTLHMRFGRDSVTRGAALSVRSGTKKELDLMFIE